MWGWIRSVGLLGALCLLLGLLGGPPAQAVISNEFVSTWDTAQTTTGSSDSKTLQLPLTSSGNYNFHVDWGDGSASDVTSYTQNTHTYSIPGVYTVRITGLIDGFRFAYNSERLKLLGVSHWGPLKLGPGGGYFYGVENMTITATDAPDLSGTTTLQNAFAYAKSLTGGVGNWDVSKVTSLDYAFNNATAFNEDLGAWNVSSVTSMSGTFAEASAFNGDVSPWDVSKVTSFYETFYRAVHFNGNLSAWNVGSAKNMSAMFESAASFNKDIGAWNVSNVTDMNFMFSTANAFNADLSSWNTSNVTNMRAMFQLDRAFNANISGWDTSKVTNLEGMFAGASAFNQNLGSWNVTAVGNMSQLFRDSGLRAPNYDGILIGWGAEPVKNGLSFWGNSKYASDAAVAARQHLVADHSWSINDGGRAAVPQAPKAVAGTAGDHSISVTWTDSGMTDYVPIDLYTATASPGGQACTATTSGCTIPGLTNGLAYTVTVTATSAAGTGSSSAATPEIVPLGHAAAPQSVAATPGHRQIAVTWAAPTDDGGSAITGYTATVEPGGSSCATSDTMCTITGLDNATRYSVIVAATTAAGPGQGSQGVAATTTPAWKQTAKVRVPQKVKYAGRTVLLRKAVRTNAGQQATAKVRIKPKGGKATISRKGKVTLKSAGKRTFTVTLRLFAPATADYAAFSYRRVWKIRR